MYLLGGSTHLESRDKITVMAAQPFGQLCVTMVVTKNRATMLSRSALSHCRVVPELSRQAIGLRGLPLSNDEKSFVREEKSVFSTSLLCPALQSAIKWAARFLFADFPPPHCIAIDCISTRISYLTRLQDRCGKSKSFTMAPTI